MKEQSLIGDENQKRSKFKWLKSYLTLFIWKNINVGNNWLLFIKFKYVISPL